jgi:hypothetical protein
VSSSKLRDTRRASGESGENNINKTHEGAVFVYPATENLTMSTLSFALSRCQHSYSTLLRNIHSMEKCIRDLGDSLDMSA